MPRRSLIEQLDDAVQGLMRNPGVPLPGGDSGLSPLVRIAAELRDLPREDFKTRLKKDLERSIAMATTTAPITATRTFAAPRLTFKDTAKAIEFYKRAFGAKETMRFELEAGIPHAEVVIGDSVIMLTDEWPEGGRYSAETTGSSPVSMSIQVPDVDAFVERAVAAGGKLAGPIADQFYGYREGTLLDPFGYAWAVSTVKEEMSVEEMHRRFRATMKEGEARKPSVNPIPKGYRTVTPYLVAQDGPALLEFTKQAFGAEETFRAVGSAGGLHAEVGCGCLIENALAASRDNHLIPQGVEGFSEAASNAGAAAGDQDSVAGDVHSVSPEGNVKAEEHHDEILGVPGRSQRQAEVVR